VADLIDRLEQVRSIHPVSLVSEQLISFVQGARLLPSYRQGRPVNSSTLWRWARKGVRLPDGTRVYLEVVRLAGRWLTSVEALRRFVAAQTPATGAAMPPVETPRTATNCRRRSERAAEELTRMGI
jgi:hypothetical protein